MNDWGVPQSDYMPDLSLGATMRLYAQEAVSLARDEFEMEIDFSTASLEDVEAILTAINNALPRDDAGNFAGINPLHDWIQEMAFLWGAYIGEVILRTWGGEWTWEAPDAFGEGAALRVGNAFIQPIAKVYRRLVDQEDRGLVAFYEEISWHLMRLAGRFGDAALPVAG
ncbi:MAG: hypothetical protein JXB35_16795 [Anaerolineae bacterium]|nr:hypothetical protein [Anaerolineae bacterium]